MVRWFRRLKRSLRQRKEEKQQAAKKRAEELALQELATEYMNSLQRDSEKIIKTFAKSVREGTMDIFEVPPRWQGAVLDTLREEKEEGEAE